MYSQDFVGNILPNLYVNAIEYAGPVATPYIKINYSIFEQLDQNILSWSTLPDIILNNLKICIRVVAYEGPTPMTTYLSGYLNQGTPPIKNFLARTTDLSLVDIINSKDTEVSKDILDRTYNRDPNLDYKNLDDTLLYVPNQYNKDILLKRDQVGLLKGNLFKKYTTLKIDKNNNQLDLSQADLKSSNLAVFGYTYYPLKDKFDLYGKPFLYRIIVDGKFNPQKCILIDPRTDLEFMGQVIYKQSKELYMPYDLNDTSVQLVEKCEDAGGVVIDKRETDTGDDGGDGGDETKPPVIPPTTDEKSKYFSYVYYTPINYKNVQPPNVKLSDIDLKCWIFFDFLNFFSEQRAAPPDSLLGFNIDNIQWGYKLEAFQERKTSAGTIEQYNFQTLTTTKPTPLRYTAIEGDSSPLKSLAGQHYFMQKLYFTAPAFFSNNNLTGEFKFKISITASDPTYETLMLYYNNLVKLTDRIKNYLSVTTKPFTIVELTNKYNEGDKTSVAIPIRINELEAMAAMAGFAPDKAYFGQALTTKELITQIRSILEPKNLIKNIQSGDYALSYVQKILDKYIYYQNNSPTGAVTKQKLITFEAVLKNSINLPDYKYIVLYESPIRANLALLYNNINYLFPNLLVRILTTNTLDFSASYYGMNNYLALSGSINYMNFLNKYCDIFRDILKQPDTQSTTISTKLSAALATLGTTTPNSLAAKKLLDVYMNYNLNFLTIPRYLKGFTFDKNTQRFKMLSEEWTYERPSFSILLQNQIRDNTENFMTNSTSSFNFNFIRVLFKFIDEYSEQTINY